jgi:transposase
MISIREILRLSFSLNFSGRQIAECLRLSRSAVWECLRRAKAAGLSWPLPEELNDAELLARLYPPELESIDRPKPDCVHICLELKRKGVTLSLLWEEYKRVNHDGYQYTQFCEIYRSWQTRVSLTMRQEHKAGHKAFSDFSGGNLKVVNPSTGEVLLARLFVCSLGASSYTYAELFFGETTEAWCLGQAHAFEYFKGTTELVVPDNPRAVVSKVCRYEPTLNSDFALMAQHFDVGVLPARVRHPKDKATVESGVGVATRWILARLRNHTFFSLAEANTAVSALLDDMNNRPFKKMSGCRRSVFESIDKPALKPLPSNRYEYTHIEYAKVNNDYHIEIDKRFYSIPHQLAGKRVEVRVSCNTIEILFQNKRVASHLVCDHERETKTLDEHMPKAHRAYKDWTPERFHHWASLIGPSTAAFIQTLIESTKHREIAFRAAFGVLRFSKSHGDRRLEGACQRAAAIRSYSYKTVKLILQNNMECKPLQPNEMPTQLRIINTNVRGSDYFAQKKETENADTSDNGKSEESEAIRDGQSA